MSFPQKVKSTLWAIVDAMAQNKTLFVKNPDKDFSRERKLGFVQMVHFCLCMESGCTAHELLKYFFFNPDEKPTVSAFIQQRAKLLPEAFRHLLSQFNLGFPGKTFMGKCSLIAADGSEFNIARNPADPSTFHPSSGKSKRGFNMLHTISLYDLVSKRYLDVITQPDRKKMNFPLSAGSLTVTSTRACLFLLRTKALPVTMYLRMQWKKAFILLSVQRISIQSAFLALLHLRVL